MNASSLLFCLFVFSTFVQPLFYVMMTYSEDCVLMREEIKKEIWGMAVGILLYVSFESFSFKVSVTSDVWESDLSSIVIMITIFSGTKAPPVWRC